MRAAKVSVVMASYNHAPYIGQAMETVLNQTFRDFEFLIGDDGSTDDTLDVVRRFIDPRMTFSQFDRNRGTFAVLNELVQCSHGKYVALIDSDNYWPVDKLEYEVALLDGHPEYAAVFGDAFIVDEADTQYDVPPFTFAQKNRSPGAWLRRFFEHGNCLCDNTVLIRRACFDTLGVFDNRLRQLADFEMWVRLIKRYAIFMSDRALSYYRWLPGRNMSEPTTENVARSTAEHFLIAHRFFDDANRDLLRDGFSDLLVMPELPTAVHCDIEKVILFFRSTSETSIYGPAYRVVGLQKLEALMMSPPHREVLQREYGIDDLVFQQLATKVDIFKVALEAGGASSPVDEWLPSPASSVDRKTGPVALVIPGSEIVEDPSVAATGLASATSDPINGERIERADVVLYVVGGGGEASGNPAVRNFPLVNRTKRESRAAHLARVIDLVDQAIASGGTHLLVPHERARWLSNHPRVAKYFSEYHELAEVSDTLGLVFTLQPPPSISRSQGEGSAPGRGSARSLSSSPRRSVPSHP